ncbi:MULTISPECIES: hypothetical protein [Streptomyces]|uniref:hypothetical protein n=1 Tax=Streptomyces TaxID=1883 RepID=UPI0018ACBF96|nr:hypothetical protein [Streptomyces sp. BRB081]MBL3808506.1 hypothetical protein [Streptomyces sp. BRB081]
MGLFRKSIQLSELTQSDEDKKKFETTYQASRGGWLKPTEKPVPGKSKKDRR